LAGSYSNEYDVDYRVNVLTTKNLIDNCLRLNLKYRILLIGSSAEYGLVSEKDNPVNEDHLLRPVSIYSLTKVYQTHLMNFYYNTHKVDVVMAITFNLMGKGISNKLFIGHFYEQIDKYKKGCISKIVLGNLQHKRDYISIEEIVKDYERIIDLGKAWEIYNVGLGKSIRILELLEEILKNAGLDIGIVEEKVQNTPNKFDVPNIFADIEKLKQLRSISKV
jgi:nucleoside-diphosphate-sugar epimerase